MGLGLIMCRNAIIHHPDGTETVCRTQKDLLEVMPHGIWFPPFFHVWFTNQRLPGYDPDTCLCPIDLPKTAEKNGYRASRYAPDGSDDPFDDHLYPA